MSNQYGPRIVTNGLVLLLDAANNKSYPGSGNSWFDLSGNNRHFTWASTPTFASESSSIFYFNTLSNRCTGPASDSFGINNTSGYTIFIISKTNAISQSQAFKFYSTGGATNAVAGRGIAGHFPWEDNIIYWDQGGCCVSSQRLSVNSGGTLTWNLWVFRSTVSTRNIFKNGVSIASTAVSAANINLSSTGVDIGGTLEGTTWNARLSNFTVYNRGLSNAEIQQNYNALKGRYGL